MSATSFAVVVFVIAVFATFGAGLAGAVLYSARS